MLNSKLWLKAFLLIFLIVAICTLSIALYTIPLTRQTTYDMAEEQAVALLDRVYDLVVAKYQEIDSYRLSALEYKKQQLRNIVSVVGGYLQKRHEDVRRGRAGKEAVQQEVLETLRTFLYDDKDYVWVSDMNSVLISHPDPKLHKADFSKVRDVYGNLIVPPLVEMVKKQGEGFYSYWWNRLGRTTHSQKLSYGRLFAPWNWLYATGLYLDDIQEEVDRRKEALVQELRNLLKGVTIAETGYLYIFDTRLKVLIHPNKQMEGHDFAKVVNHRTGHLLTEDLIAVADRNTALPYKWDRPDDPGHYDYEKLSWVRFHPAFGWYICSSVYTDELYKNARSLTAHIGWISLAVFLLSLGLANLFLKRILKPITHLSRVALEVRGGNLAVRSGVSGTDEVGILAREFDGMLDKVEENVRTLDAKVQEKTRELQENYRKLEDANRQILDGIEYGRTIQRAILPLDRPSAVRDHFVIWRPKDIIGGDIFWLAERPNGLYLAVIDCTGHGVPGAIMTMIANMALHRVISRLNSAPPGQVLKELNRVVRVTLHQHLADSRSNDGMDIGLVLIETGKGTLTFAGAGIDLFVTGPDGGREIKADRQSIGYRTSDPDHEYPDHVLPLAEGMGFYLTTDGLIGQPGGPKRIPFGWQRCYEVLRQNCGKPFAEQKAGLLAAFNAYKGDEEQRDDITVLGFTLSLRRDA
jgi:signal transduction histidine kinase